MKKLTLILVLAVCMLFSISSVCAADVNESDIQMPDRDQPIEYDNPVSQIDENVITKADSGTFTALQNKIDNAKENSTLTLENDCEYDDRFDTYGINIDKVLTIDGKGIAKAKLTVIIKSSKTYTTDKNGRVKIPLKNLAPKKYTAKITFRGNENYFKSSKNAKIVIKKLTPKMTLKKYTLTLKANKKAIKKARVYLKINKKTLKATTDKKGRATFKIKNIVKKGSYKSKVIYKGNKYYKKTVKKFKIKIR